MAHREIERRFLVVFAKLPASLRAGGRTFQQGYLASQPTVRIRHATSTDGTRESWLTIKGPGTVSRDEFEYAIPPDDAVALLAMCSASLSKTRRECVAGEHTWEVDEFHGKHAGLWLAEIELSREDEPFAHPAWLGEEVTHDARYTNGALARAGRAP